MVQTQQAAVAANQAQPQAQKVQQKLPSQSNSEIKRMEEETIKHILDRVNVMQTSGEIRLPEGYNAGNALKSAWLYLQTVANRTGQKAIDVCTNTSICNCLLEMAIRGEYPMKHCYFIMCGKELTFWEKYTGKYMRAKRDTEIAKVNPQVIYQGDNFVYTVDEEGQYQLVKHETSIKNIDIAKIVGAYAVVINKDGSRHLEVMTEDQIKKSWQQGASNGKSPAHTNFTDQMAKKTVISRACKIALDSAFDGQEGDDFKMVPPDDTKAERDSANQTPKMIQADADAIPDFDNAKFEEITPKAEQQEQAKEPEPADKPNSYQPQPQAQTTARKRPVI
nr:RecT family recombinase [uncultured Prevotella sp.]